jgi:hypothetical protein
VDASKHLRALREELMDNVAEAPAAAPMPPPELQEPEARYFNRELSWLAFNRRVL